jgi:cell division protein ZapA (FtsZ GTPase activity inhibitor)
MDAKLSVSILREHSEHLRRLATELSTDLSRLRLSMSEEEGAADTEELALLVGLAELNRSLFAATDVFYQRLHTFLERDSRGNRPTSANESH